MSAHLGIGVVGVEHTALDLLPVHVFGLNHELARLRRRLAGQVETKPRAVQHVGAAAVGLAPAHEAQVYRAVVPHLDGVRALRGIPSEGGLRLGLGPDIHRAGGLGRDAGHHDAVGHQRGTVRPVIVQIDVDMAGILLDDAAAELAVGELQRRATVVLQGDDGRGRGLAVQIGVGCVGDKLVAEARHEQVAPARLGIVGVELGHLGGLRGPARGGGRLADLHGNGACQVVVEARHHGNHAVTARALQVESVLHPLPAAAVHRVVLLVKAVVEAAPGGILVLVAAGGEVVHHGNLRAAHHVGPGGDGQRAVDDLAKQVDPRIAKPGERAPVAVREALDGGVSQVLEVLGPDKFRAVPHGTAVDTRLLHHRADAGRHGIGAAVAASQHLVERPVPSAIVVAHAIVGGQPGDERADGHALVVVETRRGGVFIEPQNGLGIGLAGGHKVGVALHHAHGIERMRPDVAAETHREEAAVAVRHLHQAGKESQSRGLRTGAFVARFVEAPELFGIVPAQEVGVASVEILEGLQVVVLYVGVSAAGRLTREPQAVGLADRCPRLVRAYGVLRHLVHSPRGVVLERERQVHAHVGFDVFGYQVDDFLRVGFVPNVDVNQPQRVAGINGTPLLGRQQESSHKQEQHERESVEHRSVHCSWS